MTREWLADFDFVMMQMRLDSLAIEECKAEARTFPAWAIDYYPWAAAQIRERNAAEVEA